ncbi:hypothetical protein ILYODFUR_012305 [Ilyodon furcidens]|uniref:Uncharacterized protein n=1 Tax=Ilyodon furcidens TaxID=33524 RepID=A0ABV0URA3_9TELE
MSFHDSSTSVAWLGHRSVKHSTVGPLATSKGHKKSAKINACQAVDHVIGASVKTFLSGVELGQPFLLCVGEKKNSIQR